MACHYYMSVNYYFILFELNTTDNQSQFSYRYCRQVMKKKYFSFQYKNKQGDNSFALAFYVSHA